MIKDYGIETKNPAFSLSRVFNVAGRVLRQITRDRRTFAMIIIMPIVVMFIFGVALSGEVKHTPVVIDNQDISVFSVDAGDNLLAALQEDDRLDVMTGDYQMGIDSVEDGDSYASIRIPSNFSQSIILLGTGNSSISVVISMYIDATKPQIRASIVGAIRDAISDVFGNTGVQLETEFAFGGAEYSGLETGTPGVMGYVLNFLVLLLSMLVLIRERIEGTELRLYTTPLRGRERLIGYIIALTIFGFIEAASILLISTLLFQVPVNGSITLLVASAILFALVNVSLAVLLSNVSQNELQAVQLAAMTALPSLALSGLLVPISSLPEIIQPISIIIPLTYAIQIFEGIMLKGFGFAVLWREFAILTGITIVFSIIAFFTVSDMEE